ncbi:SGNH/GDSL hydrolase family protein [Pedobacter terrae]|uniref:SGNH/GDSL hydrolase family protein n=1 Tax=Pedobacter terrae TaxID=405671 RepID=UPI002FF49969
MKRRQLIKAGVVTALGMGTIAQLPAAESALDGSLNLTGLARLIPKVINSGVGGNNTNDLIARLDKDCLAYQPQLTILMAGTNDMNSVKHVQLTQYLSNMDSMMKRITSAGSALLVLNILPAYEPYLFTRHPEAFYQPEGVAGRRKQLNGALERLVWKNNVHFLDICHRFEAIGKIGIEKDSLIQNMANTNKTDGIHPTANGYRFIALSVYDYLKANHLHASRSIVCFGDSITKGDGSIDQDSYPAYLSKLLS